MTREIHDVDGETWGVRSIGGATGRRGLVEIDVGDAAWTMTPSKAREIAAALVDAAADAESVDEARSRMPPR